MKILVLTNLYPNPIQPHLAPWNRAQLRALAVRHDVRVISPVLWTEEWAARRRKSDGIPGDRRVVRDGIRVRHPRYIYPPKVLRSTYGSCFRWSVAGAFRREVAERKPDVVYSSWAYPDGWAAVQLASQAGLPVAVKVHGSDITTLKQYPSRLQRTLDALRRADRVIAVSRDLADEVVRLGVPEANVEVVYNGLDTNKFSPGSRSEARERLGLPATVPTILFVGNLVPVKQVETLIQACASLRARGIDFHCHILGNGPLRPALGSLIQRLQLQRAITLQGQRAQQELADWYRSANVVVLPSRSEGIPNVLLEATACGIPFVASRVGGIPEIDSHPESRLVSPGNADGFAENIARILDNEGMLYGSSQAPSRSWEESSLDLESVLLRAIHDHREQCVCSTE